MSIATPTYLVDQNIVPISGDNPLPITSSSSGPLSVQIKGLQQNGATVKAVGVDNFGNLGASIADPLTAFNELLVAEPLPRVQIDAAYGLLTTDIETRTSLSGAATAANALFDVQTGTTAGAFAVLSLNWHEE